MDLEACTSKLLKSHYAGMSTTKSVSSSSSSSSVTVTSTQPSTAEINTSTVGAQAVQPTGAQAVPTPGECVQTATAAAQGVTQSATVLSGTGKQEAEVDVAVPVAPSSDTKMAVAEELKAEKGEGVSTSTVR